MGNHRPIKTKLWEQFLDSKGCKYDRTKASHHIWKCPDCWRSIVFRGAEKEIPADHLKTCLFTMGLTLSDFIEWVKNG